ncbi:hypothetical protein IL306_015030 [Fusarium sp. DS 682]|nr:hypothetical protein IL306_015030 [Fusarium sp. DS 682]
MVMCGEQRCSWDNFKAALQGYRTLMEDYDATLESIMVNDYHFRMNGSLRLDFALWAMSSFKAGNPRDKVFAALGLVFRNGKDHQTWEPVQVPVVEYSKDIKEIFVQANRYIISCYGNKTLWRMLDPINQTTATEDPLNLPSWTFDFREPAIIGGNTVTGGGREYGTLLAGCSVTTQTSLHINGCVLDSVDFKVDITKENDTSNLVKIAARVLAKLGRGIYSLYPIIGARDVQPQVQDPAAGAFSGTNLASLLDTIMKLGSTSIDEKLDFAGYLAWQLQMDNETPEVFRTAPLYLKHRVEIWEGVSQQQTDFDLAICMKMESQHQFRKSLVYTEKGYFRLAPIRGGAEDLVVALIGGCEELVLLRKRSADNETWYEYVSKFYMYDWTEDKIKKLEDIGGGLEVVRLDIR